MSLANPFWAESQTGLARLVEGKRWPVKDQIKRVFASWPANASFPNRSTLKKEQSVQAAKAAMGDAEEGSSEPRRPHDHILSGVPRALFLATVVPQLCGRSLHQIDFVHGSFPQGRDDDDRTSDGIEAIKQKLDA
jgi:hypothetical protein